MTPTRVVLLCAASFVAGSVSFYAQNYEELNREPCVRSLYSLDFNFLDRMEQEWIDQATPYPADSEFVTELGINDTREFVFHLYEYAAENGGHVNEIHVDNLGREYVVPYRCYVGETNFMGEPIMYRRK